MQLLFLLITFMGFNRPCAGYLVFCSFLQDWPPFFEKNKLGILKARRQEDIDLSILGDFDEIDRSITLDRSVDLIWQHFQKTQVTSFGDQLVDHFRSIGRSLATAFPNALRNII